MNLAHRESKGRNKFSVCEAVEGILLILGRGAP